jgi:hypothetical protein
MKTLRLKSETMFFEASRGIQKRSLNLEIMYYGFQKVKKSFSRSGLVFIK